MRLFPTVPGTLAFVLIASAASAQGLTFGAKGGATFATMKFDTEDEVEIDTRIGVIAGGFVTIPLGERLFVQPEVLFAQKGGKFGDLGGDVSTELDYLDVPALVRYDIGSRGLHVYGGPAVGFLLRARAVSDFGGDRAEVDVSDSIESVAFDLVFGAEFEFGRVIVDGRYMWGLSDVDKETSEVVKVKNRVAAVMAGFRF